MVRMSVVDAGLHFGALIDRVAAEGIVVELQRDNRVVARLSPAAKPANSDRLGFGWSAGDYEALCGVETFSEQTDADY